MKQGKNPTRAQRNQIKTAGLNPNNWLIVKNHQHDKSQLHIVHRETGKPRIIAV